MTLERIVSRFRGLVEILSFDNWIQLAISRTFVRPAVEIYRYHGMEITVDHDAGDVNSVRACLATPMYRQYIDQMALFGRPVNAVDLGANAGGFSLLLQSSGLQLATLAAVELNPNTCARLRKNLERNVQCLNLLILNEAVYSSTGELQLRLGKGGTGDSVLRNSPTTDGTEIHRIRTRTLDDLIAGCVGDADVHICKIDIEGAEWEVLFGPESGRIRQCVNVLMEIHPREGRSPSEVEDRMKQFGFRLQPRRKGAEVHWFRRLAS